MKQPHEFPSLFSIRILIGDPQEAYRGEGGIGMRVADIEKGCSVKGATYALHENGGCIHTSKQVGVVTSMTYNNGIGADEKRAWIISGRCSDGLLGGRWSDRIISYYAETIMVMDRPTSMIIGAEVDLTFRMLTRVAHFFLAPRTMHAGAETLGESVERHAREAGGVEGRQYTGGGR